MSAGKWTWTLLALTMLIAQGCAGGGPAGNCAGFRAILLSHQDLLTRETEDAILAHNEIGARLGCWSAP